MNAKELSAVLSQLPLRRRLSLHAKAVFGVLPAWTHHFFWLSALFLLADFGVERGWLPGWAGLHLGFMAAASVFAAGFGACVSMGRHVGSGARRHPKLRPSVHALCSAIAALASIGLLATWTCLSPEPEPYGSVIAAMACQIFSASAVLAFATHFAEKCEIARLQSGGHSSALGLWARRHIDWLNRITVPDEGTRLALEREAIERSAKSTRARSGTPRL